MKRSKVNKVLLKVAVNRGISVNEVRSEIQKAFDEGMRSNDLKVKAYWQGIPHKKDKPTIEEVICFLSKDVKNKI